VRNEKEKKEGLHILDDFFHGRSAKEEIKEALEILGNEKAEKDESVVRAMEKHWNESKDQKLLGEKETVNVLGNIHHRINLWEEKYSMRRVVRLSKMLIHAAAVLLIPALAGLLWFYQARENLKDRLVIYNEVYTPMAAQTRFILPDSSVVWLNSGSRLRYPLLFTGKEREVFLEGEGYFKIKHDPSHPFVVKTKTMDVVAYGTCFNVMAYPDDPLIRTTLIRGKVKVIKNSTRQEVYLRPNTQAVLDTVTGKMNIIRVQPRYYTSWRKGVLIFKKEPLELVAHKLERWFNCKIYIEDDQLRKYKYTGTIDMETLREVLDLMRITTPMKYRYLQDKRLVWLEPL
jgi:ferric-dicitrate binding protein FerR (iron transport regulator)